MPESEIEKIIKRYSDSIMTIPGVTGLAEGRSQGKRCIKIFVLDVKSPSLKLIPIKLEGYSVVIEEVDQFQPLN